MTENGLVSHYAGQDCLATGLSHGGLQLRGNVLRLNRHTAVVEIFTPQAALQSSEVLSEFKISVNARTAYSGRAIVKSVISSSVSLICEATLEDCWIEMDFGASEISGENLRSDLARFLLVSNSSIRIVPEFKLLIADMQAFFLDLRQWLDQVQSVVPTSPRNQEENEHETLQSLEADLQPILAGLFEQFENACRSIEPDLQPAHAHYVKRLLHPLVLCAPFMYRSFQKPLGYAGDYEMINMMFGERFQGASAFAKMLNSYFLSTPPVVAHRHRVGHLSQMLQEEICRHHPSGRPVKILNLGCGPALEIQDLMATSELSNSADFTLLDFNDETIDYVSKALQRIQKTHHRRTVIRCHKKSVVQILKEASRNAPSIQEGGYDVIYCAGLFDYLTDPVCGRLMSMFYSMLAPGGLLLATNVFAINPSRQWMDYSVDWHLIYRDRAGMMKICPDGARADACVVKSDPTGLNLFLEVRKPVHD